MPELNIPLYDFRAGILSPKLRDRVDLGLFKSGAILQENFESTLHGPTSLRPGTIHAKQTKGNTKPFFKTFTFNDNQSYTLVFTEGFLGFMLDFGAVLEDDKTVTAITKANPGVLTIASHGYVDGDEVFIDNVGGMTELNGSIYLVVKIDANTFSLTNQFGDAIDTSDFTTFTSGGDIGKVYYIESPYLPEHLPNIKYEVVEDTMYMTHTLYAPRKLIRLDHASWTLSTYTRTGDPFGQKTVTGITKANPGVVTSVAHGLTTGDEIIIEDVVGMTEVNNEVQTVTVLTLDTFSITDTSAFTTYTSGGIFLKFGDAPGACGIYGGRLAFGGSFNGPSRVDLSRSPNLTTGVQRYDDFTLGVDADHAVTYTIKSMSKQGGDIIHFLAGTRGFLACGMYGGMSKLNGGTAGAAIAGGADPAIGSEPVDALGTKNIMPTVFNTDLIYVQRGGEKLSSFRFALLSDDFKSTDESLQSDELFSGGMRQLAYQQGIPSKVYIVMEDGRLLVFLYDSTENVSSFNEALLGGGGKVLTVSAEARADNRDVVWLGVEREINGVTRYYIEYINQNVRIPQRDEIYSGTDAAAKVIDDEKFANLLFSAQRRQVHSDSSLIFDGSRNSALTPGAITGEDITFTTADDVFKTGDEGKEILVKYITGFESGIARITEVVSATEVVCEIRQDFISTDAIASGLWYLSTEIISGLDHLEGELVYAIADGGFNGTHTVTNGQIDLNAQAAYVIVGLYSVGRLKPMPLELVLSTGITPGARKSVIAINFGFRDTLGVSYGQNPYDLQKINFRGDGQVRTNRPPQLSNEMVQYPGFDTWNRRREMYIVQTVPLPCTINSIVFDVAVEFEQ